MNKNMVIGVLVAVVVIAGGYYLFTSQPSSVTNQYNTSTTNTNPTTSTTPNTPATPTPPLTLSTPTVQTDSNVSPSISTALVNGQVTPGGVPTTYWFEYGETASLGNKTTVQQIGSGFSPLSSPGYISGLRASTTYYYRLSANNNLGTVNGATYTFGTNNNPAPKAATPTVRTNSATSVARASASINGQVNANGWQTNYWFEYGKDNHFGNTTSITSVASLSSLLNVVEPLTGLDPLTKYYFRLNAQNQFGTVNGATLSFTTQGPLNPGVPTVTTNAVSSITNSGVRLNGHINPNGADTTYWFEYSNDSQLNNLINSGTSMQTTNAGVDSLSVQANVGSLNANTKYFYRLVGRNQYGTIYSSIDSFTTKS
jgi:phosphodiesterase/alkaline phosphatase D-like protein